jgi:hypothetical protein
VSEPKRDEVTVRCIKLPNEELHDFYSSPSIIRVLTSRKMKRAVHMREWGRRGEEYRV